MSTPSVTLRLDDNGRVYHPGETLAGEYQLDGVAAGELTAVEVSIVWHTEGKGDEDLAVHEFWRSNVEEGDRLVPGVPSRFETVLPRSPLSYDGMIVKLRWCVRVRAFLGRAKEVVGERGFQLGNVPSVKGRGS